VLFVFLQVCADPPIFEIADFLSPEEIDVILAAGVPGLKRSIVVDAAAGKSPASSRTSQSCYLDKPTFRWLGDKVAALTGKPFSTQVRARSGEDAVCVWEWRLGGLTSLVTARQQRDFSKRVDLRACRLAAQQSTISRVPSRRDREPYIHDSRMRCQLAAGRSWV